MHKSNTIICPGCKAETQNAISIHDPKEKVELDSSFVTVCAYCGIISKVGKNNKLHLADLQRLLKDNRPLYKKIVSLQLFILDKIDIDKN